MVTGGASFIGSHLSELLVRAGAQVTVVDDLSSGAEENLAGIRDKISLRVFSVDNTEDLRKTLAGNEIVFHLAAIHGGRGFIEKFPHKIMKNLALDYQVFSAAEDAGVRRLVHASSACVYPLGLQSSSEELLLLEEESAGFRESSQSFPDGGYGWTKLMGEYQLKTISEASTSLTGRSARIFTAYGSRENESHAIVALWAKAALRLDPFPIWGDGLQTRNFTHVFDTVHGLALLGADSSDEKFDSYNLGLSEHISIMDVIQEIFSLQGWAPKEVVSQNERPSGVRSRASDNNKIQKAFGWSPSITISEGLQELGEWYTKERLPSLSEEVLDGRLSTR